MAGQISREQLAKVFRRHARVYRGDEALRRLEEIRLSGRIYIQTPEAKVVVRARGGGVGERSTFAEPEFVLHALVGDKGELVLMEIPRAAFADPDWLTSFQVLYPRSFQSVMGEISKPEWSSWKAVGRMMVKTVLPQLAVGIAEAGAKAVAGAVAGSIVPGAGTAAGAVAGAATSAGRIGRIIGAVRSAIQVARATKAGQIALRAASAGVRGVAMAAAPELIQRYRAGAGELRGWLPTVASAIPDIVFGAIPGEKIAAGLARYLPGRAARVAGEAVEALGMGLGSAVGFEVAAAAEEGRPADVWGAALAAGALTAAAGGGRYIVGKALPLLAGRLKQKKVELPPTEVQPTEAPPAEAPPTAVPPTEAPAPMPPIPEPLRVGETRGSRILGEWVTGVRKMADAYRSYHGSDVEGLSKAWGLSSVGVRNIMSKLMRFMNERMFNKVEDGRGISYVLGMAAHMGHRIYHEANKLVDIFRTADPKVIVDRGRVQKAVEDAYQFLFMKSSDEDIERMMGFVDTAVTEKGGENVAEMLLYMAGRPEVEGKVQYTNEDAQKVGELLDGLAMSVAGVFDDGVIRTFNEGNVRDKWGLHPILMIVSDIGKVELVLGYKDEQGQPYRQTRKVNVAERWGTLTEKEREEIGRKFTRVFEAIEEQIFAGDEDTLRELRRNLPLRVTFWRLVLTDRDLGKIERVRQIRDVVRKILALYVGATDESVIPRGMTHIVILKGRDKGVLVPFRDEAGNFLDVGEVVLRYGESRYKEPFKSWTEPPVTEMPQPEVAPAKPVEEAVPAPAEAPAVEPKPAARPKKAKPPKEAPAPTEAPAPAPKEEPKPTLEPAPQPAPAPAEPAKPVESKDISDIKLNWDEPPVDWDLVGRVEKGKKFSAYEVAQANTPTLVEIGIRLSGHPNRGRIRRVHYPIPAARVLDVDPANEYDVILSGVEAVLSGYFTKAHPRQVAAEAARNGIGEMLVERGKVVEVVTEVLGYLKHNPEERWDIISVDLPDIANGLVVLIFNNRDAVQNPFKDVEPQVLAMLRVLIHLGKSGDKGAEIAHAAMTYLKFAHPEGFTMVKRLPVYLHDIRGRPEHVNEARRLVDAWLNGEDIRLLGAEKVVEEAEATALAEQVTRPPETPEAAAEAAIEAGIREAARQEVRRKRAKKAVEEIDERGAKFLSRYHEIVGKQALKALKKISYGLVTPEVTKFKKFASEQGFLDDLRLGLVSPKSKAARVAAAQRAWEAVKGQNEGLLVFPSRRAFEDFLEVAGQEFADNYAYADREEGFTHKGKVKSVYLVYFKKLSEAEKAKRDYWGGYTITKRDVIVKKLSGQPLTLQELAELAGRTEDERATPLKVKIYSEAIEGLIKAAGEIYGREVVEAERTRLMGLSSAYGVAGGSAEDFVRRVSEIVSGVTREEQEALAAEEVRPTEVEEARPPEAEVPRETYEGVSEEDLFEVVEGGGVGRFQEGRVPSEMLQPMTMFEEKPEQKPTKKRRAKKPEAAPEEKEEKRAITAEDIMRMIEEEEGELGRAQFRRPIEFGTIRAVEAERMREEEKRAIANDIIWTGLDTMYESERRSIGLSEIALKWVSEGREETIAVRPIPTNISASVRAKARLAAEVINRTIDSHPLDIIHFPHWDETDFYGETRIVIDRHTGQPNIIINLRPEETQLIGDQVWGVEALKEFARQRLRDNEVMQRIYEVNPELAARIENTAMFIVENELLPALHRAVWLIRKTDPDAHIRISVKLYSGDALRVARHMTATRRFRDFAVAAMVTPRELRTGWRAIDLTFNILETAFILPYERIQLPIYREQEPASLIHVAWHEAFHRLAEGFMLEPDGAGGYRFRDELVPLFNWYENRIIREADKQHRQKPLEERFQMFSEWIVTSRDAIKRIAEKIYTYEQAQGLRRIFALLAAYWETVKRSIYNLIRAYRDIDAGDVMVEQLFTRQLFELAGLPGISFVNLPLRVAAGKVSKRAFSDIDISGLPDDQRAFMQRVIEFAQEGVEEVAEEAEEAEEVVMRIPAKKEKYYAVTEIYRGKAAAAQMEEIAERTITPQRRKLMEEATVHTAYSAGQLEFAGNLLATVSTLVKRSNAGWALPDAIDQIIVHDGTATKLGNIPLPAGANLPVRMDFKTAGGERWRPAHFDAFLFTLAKYAAFAYLPKDVDMGRADALWELVRKLSPSLEVEIRRRRTPQQLLEIAAKDTGVLQQVVLQLVEKLVTKYPDLKDKSFEEIVETLQQILAGQAEIQVPITGSLILRDPELHALVSRRILENAAVVFTDFVKGLFATARQKDVPAELMDIYDSVKMALTLFNRYPHLREPIQYWFADFLSYAFTEAFPAWAQLYDMSQGEFLKNFSKLFTRHLTEMMRLHTGEIADLPSLTPEEIRTVAPIVLNDINHFLSLVNMPQQNAIRIHRVRGIDATKFLDEVVKRMNADEDLAKRTPYLPTVLIALWRRYRQVITQNLGRWDIEDESLRRMEALAEGYDKLAEGSNERKMLNVFITTKVLPDLLAVFMQYPTEIRLLDASLKNAAANLPAHIAEETKRAIRNSGVPVRNLIVDYMKALMDNSPMISTQFPGLSKRMRISANAQKLSALFFLGMHRPPVVWSANIFMVNAADAAFVAMGVIGEGGATSPLVRARAGLAKEMMEDVKPEIFDRIDEQIHQNMPKTVKPQKVGKELVHSAVVIAKELYGLSSPEKEHVKAVKEEVAGILQAIADAMPQLIEGAQPLHTRYFEHEAALGEVPRELRMVWERSEAIRGLIRKMKDLGIIRDETHPMDLAKVMAVVGIFSDHKNYIQKVTQSFGEHVPMTTGALGAYIFWRALVNAGVPIEMSRDAFKALAVLADTYAAPIMDYYGGATFTKIPVESLEALAERRGAEHLKVGEEQWDIEMIEEGLAEEMLDTLVSSERPTEMEEIWQRAKVAVARNVPDDETVKDHRRAIVKQVQTLLNTVHRIMQHRKVGAEDELHPILVGIGRLANQLLEQQNRIHERDIPALKQLGAAVVEQLLIPHSWSSFNRYALRRLSQPGLDYRLIRAAAAGADNAYIYAGLVREIPEHPLGHIINAVRELAKVQTTMDEMGSWATILGRVTKEDVEDIVALRGEIDRSLAQWAEIGGYLMNLRHFHQVGYSEFTQQVLPKVREVAEGWINEQLAGQAYRSAILKEAPEGSEEISARLSAADFETLGNVSQAAENVVAGIDGIREHLTVVKNALTGILQDVASGAVTGEAVGAGALNAVGMITGVMPNFRSIITLVNQVKTGMHEINFPTLPKIVKDDITKKVTQTIIKMDEFTQQLHEINGLLRQVHTLLSSIGQQKYADQLVAPISHFTLLADEVADARNRLQGLQELIAPTSAVDEATRYCYQIPIEFSPLDATEVSVRLAETAEQAPILSTIFDTMRKFTGNIHGVMKSFGKAGALLSDLVNLINASATHERAHLYAKLMPVVSTIRDYYNELRRKGWSDTDIQVLNGVVMLRLAGFNPYDDEAITKFRAEIQDVLAAMEEFSQSPRVLDSEFAAYWQEKYPQRALRALADFYETLIFLAQIFPQLKQPSEFLENLVRAFLDDIYSSYASAGIPFVGSEALQYIQHYLPFTPHAFGKQLMAWVSEALGNTSKTDDARSAFTELFKVLALAEVPTTFETVAKHRRHLPASVLLLGTEMDLVSVLSHYTHGIANYVGEYTAVYNTARQFAVHPEMAKILPHVVQTINEAETGATVPTTTQIYEAWAKDIVLEAGKKFRPTDIERAVAEALRLLHGQRYPTFFVDPTLHLRRREFLMPIDTFIQFVEQGKPLLERVKALQGRQGYYGLMVMREFINPARPTGRVYTFMSALPIAAFFTLRTVTVNALEGLASSYFAARDAKEVMQTFYRQLKAYPQALEKLISASGGIGKLLKTYLKAPLQGLDPAFVQKVMEDPVFAGIWGRFIDNIYSTLLARDAIEKAPELVLHYIMFNAAEFLTLLKSGIERSEYFKDRVAPLLAKLREGKLSDTEALMLDEIMQAHRLPSAEAFLETAVDIAFREKANPTTEDILNKARELFVTRAVMERHHEYGAWDMPPFWHIHPFWRVALYWLRSWSLQHTHKVFYHLFGRWQAMRKKILENPKLTKAQKESLLADITKRQLQVALTLPIIAATMGAFYTMLYSVTAGRHPEGAVVDYDGTPDLNGIVNFVLKTIYLPPGQFGIISDVTYQILQALRNPKDTTAYANIFTSPFINYWFINGFRALAAGTKAALGGWFGLKEEEIEDARYLIAQLALQTAPIPLMSTFRRQIARAVGMSEQYERGDIRNALFPMTDQWFGRRVKKSPIIEIHVSKLMPLLEKNDPNLTAKTLLNIDPESVFEMLSSGSKVSVSQARQLLHRILEYYRKTDPQAAAELETLMPQLLATLDEMRQQDQEPTLPITAKLERDVIKQIATLPEDKQKLFLFHLAVGAVASIADPAKWSRISVDPKILAEDLWEKRIPRTKVLGTMARISFVQHLRDAIAEELNILPEEAEKIVADLSDKGKMKSVMEAMMPFAHQKFFGAHPFSKAFHKAFGRAVADTYFVAGALYPELVNPQAIQIANQWTEEWTKQYNYALSRGYDSRSAFIYATRWALGSDTSKSLNALYQEQMRLGISGLYKAMKAEPFTQYPGLATIVEANLQRWYPYAERYGEKVTEREAIPEIQTTPSVLR